MKLAVISEVAGYPWAGSEEFWLAAAVRGLERGDRVTACLHRDLLAAPPLEEFRAKGGRVIEWKRPRIARLTEFQQRFQPNFDRKPLGNPDTILLSAGSLPSMVHLPGLMRFLRAASTRVVVLCQFNADCLPVSPRDREEIAWLLHRAQACVFVSQHNLRLAERQCGMRLSDAKVISNPIRTILTSPLPQTKAAIPAFACVARMETLWKGQDVLVEILSQPEWLAKDWTLRFYGDGPDQTHLEKWVAASGLSDRIEFAGYVRSVSEIWSKGDLMVLPSRGEGAPLAVLEAMMCGRPVIATDVGGNAEIIEDGVTGFIAEAPTVRSFGRAMERAWQSRDRWPEMGLSAHQRARELARSDPAGKLLALLERIANT